MAQALTYIVAPDTATLEAVESGKINSNTARPTENQNASTKSPADPDSDITAAVSFGSSDGDSEYVESIKNFPKISTITLDLAGHIGELEKMH